MSSPGRWSGQAYGAYLGWAVLDQQFTTQSGVPLDNCRRFHQRVQGSATDLPGGRATGRLRLFDRDLPGSEGLRPGERPAAHLPSLGDQKGGLRLQAQGGPKRPADYLSSHRLPQRSLRGRPLGLADHQRGPRAGPQRHRVSTCPVSNMKLATGGVAPIPEMLSNGVTVSIGTDGSTTNNSLDMFGEMKTLSLLQKASRWDPTVLPAQKVLDLATIDAAKAVRMDHLIGSIEVGKRADLVILDGRAANLRPVREDTMVSNLVYSSFGNNVTTVLCDGAVIMEEGVVLTIDEEAALAEAEDAARELLG